MDNKDQIEDLFRKRAADFELKPSMDAWDRLEQKLDESVDAPKAKVFSLYRVSLAAACLTFIVASAIVVSWYLEGNASSQSASVILEEGSLSSSDQNSYARFIAYQPQLNYEGVQIDEGQSGSRLIARNSKPFIPEDMPIAQADIPTVHKEEGKVKSPAKRAKTAFAVPSTPKVAKEATEQIVAPSLAMSKVAPVSPEIEEVPVSEADDMSVQSPSQPVALSDSEVTSYGLSPEVQNDIIVRGARTSSTDYYIDGVRVKEESISSISTGNWVALLPVGQSDLDDDEMHSIELIWSENQIILKHHKTTFELNRNLSAGAPWLTREGQGVMLVENIDQKDDRQLIFLVQDSSIFPDSFQSLLQKESGQARLILFRPK